MKKHLKTLATAMLCLAMALLVSCKKDNVEPSGGGTGGGGDTPTPASGLPKVTTKDVTDITSSYASCGGIVTSDEGESVICRGVCWGTSKNPTISESHTSDGSGLGSFNSSITGLSPNTTYYVRAYAVNNAGTGYGDNVSFTTKNVSGGVINGHEYVDLGLPSGTLWAKSNVGAVIENEWDGGLKYAWGETEAKYTYKWNTYKWCTMTNNDVVLTKYNTDPSCGTVDGKTQLDYSDDVARVEWGSPWRMPTEEEFKELFVMGNNGLLTMKWEINGIRITSTNGNSIFLRAAGHVDDGWKQSPDDGKLSQDYGWYWASTLAENSKCASGIFFDDDLAWMSGYTRRGGLSVRPVCSAQK